MSQAFNVARSASRSTLHCACARLPSFPPLVSSPRVRHRTTACKSVLSRRDRPTAEARSRRAPPLAPTARSVSPLLALLRTSFLSFSFSLSYFLLLSRFRSFHSLSATDYCSLSLSLSLSPSPSLSLSLSLSVFLSFPLSFSFFVRPSLLRFRFPSLFLSSCFCISCHPSYRHAIFSHSFAWQKKFFSSWFSRYCSRMTTARRKVAFLRIECTDFPLVRLANRAIHQSSHKRLAILW